VEITPLAGDPGQNGKFTTAHGINVHPKHDHHLVIADRPVPDDYVGFTEARCREKFGGAAFASVDLANVAHMDGTLPALGEFDVVVMAEVLEHLPVHPVDVLSRLIARLNPRGALYLTTPNFLSDARLAAIGRGENPVAVFPRGDDNWDAHHHFREYEAVELARFLREAGGLLDAFLFSGCWDPPGSPLAAHRRGNLVFVVRRALPPASLNYCSPLCCFFATSPSGDRPVSAICPSPCFNNGRAGVGAPTNVEQVPKTD
jgi:SAM-dependent methyltransferase